MSSWRSGLLSGAPSGAIAGETPAIQRHAHASVGMAPKEEVKQTVSVVVGTPGVDPDVKPGLRSVGCWIMRK